MTCGSQGCFDIYQTGDHHHIVTSNSASSLTITYGKGDTLGAWHPNSPWTCTCTAASCAKLVGTFKCSADFYGSTSLEIGLSSGAYTFEPACVDPACMSLDVRTCASPSPWVVVHANLPCAANGAYETQYNAALSTNGVANTAACQAICAASSACDFFSYSFSANQKCATYYQGTCAEPSTDYVGHGYTTYAKPTSAM